MSDGTTLLFALPGFRVLDVAVDAGGGRVVLIESIEAEGGCPACGVLSALVKDRPTSRVKDRRTVWRRCGCGCASDVFGVRKRCAPGVRSPSPALSCRLGRG